MTERVICDKALKCPIQCLPHAKPHGRGIGCESALCSLYRVNGRRQRAECIPVVAECRVCAAARATGEDGLCDGCRAATIERRL